MATLPKKIRIGGRTADVKQEIELRNPQGGLCLGQWSRDNFELALGPHENEETRKETLVHEIVHALFDHFNLNGTPPDEEHITDCMARGFLMIMNDNPKLRRYLFE